MPSKNSTASVEEAKPKKKSQFCLPLSDMGAGELKDLIAEAGKVKARKVREERDLRIKQIKVLAKVYKIDLMELAKDR